MSTSMDHMVSAAGTPSPGSAQKRKNPPLRTSHKPSKKKRVGPRDDATAVDAADGDEAGKPKRTRTGCLTCRDRHLKCDEALPSCNNCRKSNRECHRGVRLNFLDTWVEQPPRIVTNFGTRHWLVEFVDESRNIAGEYQGGEERYGGLEDQQEAPSHTHPTAADPYAYPTAAPPAPSISHQPLPPIQGIAGPDAPRQHHSIANVYDPQLTQQPPSASSTHSSRQSQGMMSRGSVGNFTQARVDLLPDEYERREYLDGPEETLLMQVFVEEVGLWMDSMDPHKHFSRLLPFHSLSEPMLINAFLACGARHLMLVNPAYTEETALHYYDTATRYLLKSLQNPERDTVVCATTAVILNVYEIMSERAMQRMNHIAGARALIKECGWNARAQGIGAACFWLNVGLEVLSCLHFNWQVAWDPDEWGVDMDFAREVQNGREEIWTHRMLYLLAKVCNFRATQPHGDEAQRLQHRYDEWMRLRGMIDAWNEGIPRTMHPMAYVSPSQTASKSAFPEIWLIKRSTIVARLFYHMAMLLLAQTHPYVPPTQAEMADLQTRHATMICGITAHVKDRGVASVAIRSLAHAAEVLTSRREQEEVLRVFEKINRETGWRIGFIYIELKEKWGWHEEPSPQQYAQTHAAARQQQELQNVRNQAAIGMQQQQHQHSPQSFDYAHQQHQGQQQQQQQQPNMSVMSSVPPPPLPAPHMRHTPTSANNTPPMQQLPAPQQQQPPPTSAPSKKPPQGIPNPLYAKADFSLPQHPYQNFWVAPVSGPGAAPSPFSHAFNGESHLYYGH